MYSKTIKKNTFDNFYKKYFQEYLIKYNISFPLPVQFKFSTLSKGISVYESGKRVKYIAKNAATLSVTTDIPIPKTIGIYYFEILIDNIGTSSIGIGIVSKNNSCKDHVPGLELNSIGYHSNNGYIFIGDSINRKYGQKYTSGDYIGCCLNFIDGVVFFTLNGKKLDELLFENMKKQVNINSSFFPAIGMSGLNQEIIANFGETEFCFNINEYKMERLNNYYNEIISVNNNININNNIKSSEFDMLVYDYLLYYGYEETFMEFSKELFGNKNKYFNNLNIQKRKEIMNLLSNRNYSQTRNIIKNHFANNEKVLAYIDFYESLDILCSLLASNQDNISKFNFISDIKTNIIFNNKISFIYNNDYKLQINKLISLVISSKAKYNDIMKEYYEMFSNEEIQMKINSILLSDNYSIFTCEIEMVFKQLILCLEKCISFPYVKVKVNETDYCYNELYNIETEENIYKIKQKITFILTSPELFFELNERIIAKETTCDKVSLSLFVQEYLSQLKLD